MKGLVDGMELFKLLGTIAVDNDQADKALDETTGKAENAGKKSESAFSKIGGAALKVGKAVIAAGTTLGTAWIAAIEGSREYRTEMGKLDTAFTTNGHTSAAATKTYKELQSVLGDTDVSVEAANHLAVMTDNEKDLNTWTDICTGVFATFGDSLPIEGLTEAANETAKVGKVTGPLADALNWAGISEDEFNEKLADCTTEQERQKLIMNTLNKTYSKAADTYRETNKDVIAANRAHERLTGAVAKLGEVGEPILTAIKNKVADMVTASIPKLQAFIAKVKDMAKWIKDNKTTIHNWTAAVIGTTVAVSSFILVMKWSKIMMAAAKAIKAVRAAMLLLNAAMRANLIGMIVSLILGLIAAFIYLWKNNEGFRKFWISMWDKIKSACATAVRWIKDKFGDLKAAVKTVGDTFGRIKDAIADKLDTAREKVSGFISKVKGFFPLSIGKIFSNFKIPKLSVSGGKAPYGIAGKGKLPSFDVKWNAEGGILTKPAIFGMAGNTMLGGGEAGAEAIAPIETLQAYIRDSIRGQDEGIRRTIIEQNRLMMDFLARNMPKVVRLDGRALVGELTPAIDSSMADRLRNTMRGNTR